MKKQFNQKKISLNKETIANLTGDELKRIHGGAQQLPRQTQDDWKCSVITD